ncbi:MAG: thiamine phosphate synthase [Terracidiphilus sp.]
MTFSVPKIYPILDAGAIPAAGREEFLRRLGGEMAAAGVRLMEYRNKTGTVEQIVADAAILRAAMPAGQVKLILDDRADLIERIGFDGVHVDAGDVSPSEARRLVGPDRIVGTFGGNLELITGILAEPADYFAVGPVWATVTKQTDLPLIGVEGVRRLREQVGPDVVLTAVGGIKLETAPLVLEAGATAVAVVGAIFRAPHPAAEFRRWASALGSE